MSSPTTSASQQTDLPTILAASAGAQGYPWSRDGDRVVYFLNENAFRDTPEDGGRMTKTPETIYNLLHRNAASPTTYFHLPPRQIVSVGTQIDL